MSKSASRAARGPLVCVLCSAGMEFQQPLHPAPQSSERNLETRGPPSQHFPFPMFFCFLSICLEYLESVKTELY